MKFLLDSCVSGRLKTVLEQAGHDAAWCGDWPHDPGDDAVLAHAHPQARAGLEHGAIVTATADRLRVRQPG